ncbi:MAG: hypothetical protein ACHQNT_11200 [Bacteroidia bacterium]
MKSKKIIANSNETKGVNKNYLSGELTSTASVMSSGKLVGFDPFPRIDIAEIFAKKLVDTTPTQAGSGKTCTCDPDTPTQIGSGKTCGCDPGTPTQAGSGKTCTCDPDTPTQIGSGKTCGCDPGTPTQAGSGKTCTCDPDTPTQVGSGKTCGCQAMNQLDADIHGELKSPGFSAGKKAINVLGSYNPFIA